MIGTNMPTTYVKLIDGQIMAIISDNTEERTMNVLPLEKLFEDGSYDSEYIIAEEVSYDSIRASDTNMSLLENL